ncbi:MAG: coenzyme F420-0:L-glutamate ligase [Burkholderiales bacterium]
MTRATGALNLRALAGIPEVRPGDDLGALIVASAHTSGIVPQAGDVLVVAQKVVSKAEDRFVDLASVGPSAQARMLADVTGKDARLIEVILRESVRVVRAVRDVLIVEHRLGFVVANAGVDQSNVGGRAGGALRLPEDPDASAQRIREALRRAWGCEVAVIVSDSFGRAWRRGTIGVALGAAGLPATVDKRGGADRDGRVLRSTIIGFADEIASAASLLMGQADEGQPVVHVRGLAWTGDAMPARELVRPPREDLFR